jgi:ABC-type multidrug transport system fused ATPase/permease subunit
MAATERIFEVIDTEPDVRDSPSAIPLPPIKGEVVFENVSFGYDPDKLVLKNLDLSVKPGETIAVLGPTGSGKSTLLYLIPRFYDISSGEITIDSYDVRDVKLKSLREQIGIALQDIFLFSATIKENIAFGRSEATIEEIMEAAKAAQIHDFIESLPQGYDTIIGERGVTLSGGQKQRMTIARTLLKDPRILIFDDTTSFVDTETEHKIQKALEVLLKGRTAFIVTQRLSAIKDADKIIVLGDGEIVESGTHDELLTKDGIYATIYRTQFVPMEEILARKMEGGI